MTKLDTEDAGSVADERFVLNVGIAVQREGYVETAPLRFYYHDTNPLDPSTRVGVHAHGVSSVRTRVIIEFRRRYDH